MKSFLAEVTRFLRVLYEADLLDISRGKPRIFVQDNADEPVEVGSFRTYRHADLTGWYLGFYVEAWNEVDLVVRISNVALPPLPTELRGEAPYAFARSLLPSALIEASPGKWRPQHPRDVEDIATEHSCHCRLILRSPKGLWELKGILDYAESPSFSSRPLYAFLTREGGPLNPLSTLWELTSGLWPEL